MKQGILVALGCAVIALAISTAFATEQQQLQTPGQVKSFWESQHPGGNGGGGG